MTTFAYANKIGEQTEWHLKLKMSHEEPEKQGTGLRDIYELLINAPPERVQSLTFQLGDSPEDNIIHAFCLFILQRKEQALNKLQMLGDNYLANHLAGIWKKSGGKLEEFEVDFTGESLTLLARVFKVLSEHRLCDPCRRNLAYTRALSTDGLKTSRCEDLEYERLREEAKDVCGPQVVAWKSHDPCSLDERKTTLKASPIQDQDLPSPLQANSCDPSYPSHLEISIPSTAIFEERKKTPETAGTLQNSTASVSVVREVKSSGRQSQSPAESFPECNKTFRQQTDPTIVAACAAGFTKLNDSLPKAESLCQPLASIAEPKCTLPTATSLPKDKEDEDEVIFYSFVILHAPEDEETAEIMKEKLETAIGEGRGATYSDAFDIPGKRTLKCIEDAINNSAFTLLLLTTNFNTRLDQLKTDSALMNSVQNKHKYNTVIPVLPRENPMPKRCIPLLLQTLVLVDEKNKSFEKKLQKAMSTEKVRQQRKIWTKQQEKLKQNQSQCTQECETAQMLENFTFVSPLDFTNTTTTLQTQRHIHIENAQYIMIGNDSKMTVGGGTEKDDSVN